MGGLKAHTSNEYITIFIFKIFSEYLSNEQHGFNIVYSNRKYNYLCFYLYIYRFDMIILGQIVGAQLLLHGKSEH